MEFLPNGEQSHLRNGQNIKRPLILPKKILPKKILPTPQPRPQPILLFHPRPQPQPPQIPQPNNSQPVQSQLQLRIAEMIKLRDANGTGKVGSSTKKYKKRTITTISGAIKAIKALNIIKKGITRKAVYKRQVVSKNPSSSPSPSPSPSPSLSPSSNYKNKCKWCGAGFVKKWNLLSHELTHDKNREKKHSCKYCNYKSHRRNDVTRHEERKHPGKLLMEKRHKGTNQRKLSHSVFNSNFGRFRAE